METHSNHKDTYLATSITLIVVGILFLIDRLFNLSAHGLGWLVNRDNLLLFTAIIFLIFKRDKSIGIVLLAIWAILNIGLIISLLGQLSSYLLPLVLLVVGVILFIMYKR